MRKTTTKNVKNQREVTALESASDGPVARLRRHRFKKGARASSLIYLFI